ncbi:MAG: DUF6527 family protein [Gallionellaceae bacterium]
MMQQIVLEHKFVEFVPDSPKEGILYVCIEIATVVHKCCCGCGNEVVTPLSPTDWRLTFDGETITLHPSIGNWGFKCQSHYWIRNNMVKWAGQLPQEQIDAGRAHDRWAKDRYFGTANESDDMQKPPKITETAKTTHSEKGIWWKLKKCWFNNQSGPDCIFWSIVNTHSGAT